MRAIHTVFKGSSKNTKRLMRSLLIPPVRAYIRHFPSTFAKRLLWNRVASHVWWLETNVVAQTVFGEQLFVFAGDIVGKYIYYFGIWEPNLTNWIQTRLEPGDVFIDVGANVGYYCVLASKLVGETGKVVAVEALPSTFNRLTDNLERNCVGNIRSVNVAAWDKEESIKMFSAPENPVGTTTVMPEWAEQWNLKKECEIAAKPLSSILSAEEAKRGRLIKIDVEGAEWNVIAGMEPLIEHSRWDLEVIIEVSRSMLERQGKSIEDVITRFGYWGFHSYLIENDYSAASYLDRQHGGTAPMRIERAPNNGRDQFDLVFSRVDAPSL